MKNRFLLPLMAMLPMGLMMSCSSDLTEEINNSEQKIEKLYVTIEDMNLVDEAGTRSELVYSDATDKFDFKWSSGDVLGVFPNEGAQAFFPIAEEYVGKNSAAFDGGGWALKTGYSYSLYCPYDYGNTDKYAIPVNYLNQKQEAKNDYSHLNNYNYFSSKQSIEATGPELDFNVGFVGAIIWLKLTMPADGTFTKIRLVSESTPFIKKGNLNIAAETPEVTPVEGEESPIMTLKLNNIEASAGEVVDFYMWILPRDFSNSMIKAELVTDDMRVYSVNLTKYNFKAGTYYRFKRGGAGQTQFSDIVGTEPESIVFEDPEVERICLENWDTNKDDVFDADEAAAVTTLGDVFNGNRTITSFDELKYFTGLTEINKDAFGGCDFLHILTVPENVKTICEGAFLGCRYLYYLTLPEGLERIDKAAFERCDNLGAIDIPDNVKYIGESAFYLCNNSAWVDLPAELEEIAKDAFGHVTSFESVDFAESEKLVKIGKEAFYFCTTLKEAVFPKSLTTIEAGAFEHCWNLKRIVIPREEGLISIGETAFDVSDCPIYVPSALVEDYKSTYPQYAERFSNLETQEGGTVISNPDMQGGW